MKLEQSTPTQRFAKLVLDKAIVERAESVVLERCKTYAGEEDFAIWFQKPTGVSRYEPSFAPPACLHSPVARLFLNLAGLAYWKKGRIEGRLDLEDPASSWQVETDDPENRVVLRNLSVPIHSYEDRDRGPFLPA